MTRSNPYEFGLDKNEANFVALSPLSYIERTASVYPDRKPDHATHLKLARAGAAPSSLLAANLQSHFNW